MRVLLRIQAIVNLQKTPKDARAAIVIHAKIDAVMRCLMQELGIAIPVRGHLSLASSRQKPRLCELLGGAYVKRQPSKVKVVNIFVIFPHCAMRAQYLVLCCFGSARQLACFCRVLSAGSRIVLASVGRFTRV